MRVAYLIPCNISALRQFEDAKSYMADHGGLSKHLQKVTLRPKDGDDPTVRGSALDEDMDEDDAYLVSLADAQLPSDFRKGWIVGRSSISAQSDERALKVDFLIARPGGDGGGSVVAPAHLRLSFSSQSGCLLLSPCSEDSSVEVRSSVADYERIPFGSQHAVMRDSTWLRLGGKAKYELLLVGSSRDSAPLFDRLKTLYKTYNHRSIDRVINFSPSDKTRIFKASEICLDTSTLGSGASGWVHKGFTRTGEPVAVKTFAIRHSREYEAAVSEFELAFLCRNAVHVQGATHIWCEHDVDASKAPCGACRQLQKKGLMLYMSSRLAWGTFAKLLLNEYIRANLNWIDELALFHQVFQGLEEIWNLGLIHRDITLRNILVVSLWPVRASISDFGKAVRYKDGERCSNTAIGPVPLVAPEVWFGGGYGRSIDLYSLALSLATAFVPLPGEWAKGERVTYEALCRYRRDLRAFGTKQPHTEALLNMLCSILHWDEQDRISLEEALMHDCWKEVRDTDSADSHYGGAPQKRRRIAEAPENDRSAGADEDTRLETVKTEAFSPSLYESRAPMSTAQGSTQPFNSSFYRKTAADETSAQ